MRQITRFRILFLCGLSVLMMSACGDPVTRAKGTVRDAAGTPLAGVTVVLESNDRGDFAKEEDQTTGADGTFSFINITAPATKARLVFEKQGYEKLEKEIRVNKDNSVDVTLQASQEKE
jgi:hypothetical protein